MKKGTKGRRGTSVHITLSRAARLYRMISTLSRASMGRQELLDALVIGLRTFYRELELLKKCGIRIRLEGKLYVLKTTAQDAAGRLPFPDPQLSFAEMKELSEGSGPASIRLAELLRSVTGDASREARPRKSRKSS